MRMRKLLLVVAVVLSSCMRSPFPPAVPVEDDRTIALPRFHDRPTLMVGEGNNNYELDGELLRAVMIAAQDFLPPRTRGLSCGNRLEAQRYLVNRRDNVIFVYIYEDEEYCGGGYVALDSGAKYAISTDGRILRRVFDGHPEEPLDALNPDGGSLGVPARPGVVPGYEPIGSRPSQPSSPEARDGETSPREVQDGGSGSSLPEPDGGTPEARVDGGPGLASPLSAGQGV